MNRIITIALLTIGLSSTAISCAEAASDQEIIEMCEHLAEIRGKDKSVQNTKKCIDEAKKEGVSKRQALCRISAINKSEYWNRCRTGEAKTRKQ